VRDADETPIPTADQLNTAHMRFEQAEPRSIFYPAATDLVELALAGKARLGLADAIAVLLLTWNESFYRPRPAKRHSLRQDVGNALAEHECVLRSLRRRQIATLCEDDARSVKPIFATFDAVLWPVGAAKSLHLLAPDFFPLWDRAIAASPAYRVPLGRVGTNTGKYWDFMLKVRAQCERICWSAVAAPHGRLKALDEYNYIVYTLRSPLGETG
jgi:hypothetical protein